jgi:EpsI family protein
MQQSTLDHPGNGGENLGTSLRNRLWVSIALLAGAALFLHAANRPLKVPARHSLKELPLSLGKWRGTEVPLTDYILAAAGVNDYVNRVYTAPQGGEIDLYVGYYNSQRSGELIHSPKNCLPGAGWEWLRTGRLNVQVPNSPPIRVNDFRIAKGLQQDLVLYWYQGRGRAVADEIQSRLWMISDAITRRRTDGSLVRIIVPIQNSEDNARAQAVSFLQALWPSLSESIPD